MTRAPETHYARSGDVWIAYQVLGEGPIDILMSQTSGSPIDSHFELPEYADWLERFGSFSRLIRYDRRGTGMSDPVSPADPPTLDQWVLDGLSVLDAANSDRASLIGTDPAGSHVSMMFAATQPARTGSLVLFQPNPCPMQRADWPWGLDPRDLSDRLDSIEHNIVAGTPPIAPDEARFREWRIRAIRHGAGPSFQKMLFKIWYESDLRPLVGTIQAPTLVVSRPVRLSRDPFPGREEAARWVAEQIPGARLIVVPSAASMPFIDDSGEIVDAVQEFLTGTRPVRQTDDRIFATLLFTDIVSSTEHTAALGDRKWRTLLDQHDRIVNTELERHRGRVVNPTGDGLLASFDGPARAVRCAQAISERLTESGLPIRAGLHAGEVEARGQDVTGIAVNIASRVSSLAGAGEILVSRTVTDLVAGSGLEFDERGEHELRGVPGRWQLYAVKS